MESEEFEQIPWASLVAQQDDGVDKRIYLAIGVVGVLVIAVLGLRLLGGGSQPGPPPAVALESPPTSVVIEQAASTPPTSLVIAEADLRAGEPVTESSTDRLIEVTAEWFVTDWFTRDGSSETVRSIMDALSPDVFVDVLPHESADAVTFVEWAKSVGLETTADGVEVTVAYRVIGQTTEGFAREPVGLVMVTLTREGNDVRVIALPES